MRAARLLLVRHGRREGDRPDHLLMAGQADLPLSAEGWNQARALGQALRVEPLAAAYSSPARRTMDTARALIADRAVPLHSCRGLLEIDCGTADGLPVEEVKRLYPSHWAANERQDDDDFRWPGGESYAELRRRVLVACHEIAARHPGETALVISHAGAINQVVGHLRGVPAGGWGRFRPRSCTITEVVWQGQEARLIRYDREPSAVE